MKVCIVSSVFPRHQDDLEVPWLRELVKRCRERGVDMHVFAPSYRGLRSHMVDGIPVHRFRYFFAPWETLTHDEGAPNKIHKLHYKVITVFYIIAGCVALIRLHRREQFDVLHVHWPFPHAFFALAARLVGPAPIVLNFYGADVLLMRKFGWVRWFLAYFIRRAQRVVSISRFTAEQVRSVVSCEITIIPYGAAVTMRAMRTGAAVDPNLVYSAGRMVERKGFPWLIRAMPLVRERCPNARLVITGTGALLEAHRRLVRELAIAHYVELPGQLSNECHDELFATCAVFVLPSIVDSKGDTEGLGVVLLEAAMYRRPLVASRVGGILDVIEDGVTGLLVPEKDPRALADAIVKVLTDPELARRLGDAGHDYVRRTFDWNAITGRMIEVYCGVEGMGRG